MTDSYQSLNNYISEPSSILLLAPAEDAPDDSACIDLLTLEPPSDTNVLSVTFSASPSERLSIWQRESEADLPARVTIIDGRRDMQGRELPRSDSEPVSVRGLAENADLHDIGLAVAAELGAWRDTAETSVMCVHSISTLLDTYDTEEVLSLITSVNELCDRLGVTAHHHLDPKKHDDETVAMLRPLYDAVIEYAPDDGWIPIEREESTPDPTFTATRAPPGGTARTDPDHPETVPMRYSFETILDLLSAPRRRTLLYYLKNRVVDTIPLDQLIEGVHAVDQSVPVRDSSSRETVRSELLETHLPRLQEVGIVRYDDDAETVHYTPNEGLESYLEYVETVELG